VVELEDAEVPEQSSRPRPAPAPGQRLPRAPDARTRRHGRLRAAARGDGRDLRASRGERIPRAGLTWQSLARDARTLADLAYLPPPRQRADLGPGASVGAAGPRGAEGVGDEGRGEADEQARLERERDALDEPARAPLRVRGVGELGLEPCRPGV